MVMTKCDKRYTDLLRRPILKRAVCRRRKILKGDHGFLTENNDRVLERGIYVREIKDPTYDPTVISHGWNLEVIVKIELMKVRFGIHKNKRTYIGLRVLYRGSEMDIRMMLYAPHEPPRRRL